MSKKTLVVVESPVKAKTIHQYLGRKYTVISSMGHLVDLPKSRLGVNIEKDFDPDYITIRGRGKILNAIKAEASKSKGVLLASDNDREGEAIAWNIKNAILKANPELEIKRIRFNEITKGSIQEAIKNPIYLSQSKVNAQKARRILDRLVGYYLSPLLWDKLKKGLSAGRVQSAALKLICDREAKIKNFEPEEYWEVVGRFRKGRNHFEAKLSQYGGEKMKVKNEEESNSLIEKLFGKEYEVIERKDRGKNRNPQAPLTTSQMQQEASNFFGYGAEKTMRIAQSLYEGVLVGKERVGLITYMRTDSTRISDGARQEVLRYIGEKYGKEYMSEKKGGNFYKNKKGVQDAHEAIRPTSVDRDVEFLSRYLSAEQLKVYTLIWKKFVSSQMSRASYEETVIEIGGGGGVFRVVSTRLIFQGFLKVYGFEGKRVSGKGVSEKKGKEEKMKFSGLEVGEKVDLKELRGDQHFTQAPARYSEASLVKKLEESGVGRPSTYAPTLKTLFKRYYIKKEKKQLVSSKLGELVNHVLSEFFPRVTDLEFTANMEDLLDRVETEELNWVKILRDFYEGFIPDIEDAKLKILSMKNLLNEDSGKVCDRCGKKMLKKLGRYGYFLACEGFPVCKNSRAIPLGECIERGCEGEIMSKKGKAKIFYGCSRYPECKFISWEKPSEERCEGCGKVLFNRGKKGLECKNQDCARAVGDNFSKKQRRYQKVG